MVLAGEAQGRRERADLGDAAGGENARSRVRLLAGRHFPPPALPAPGGVVVGPELGLGGDLELVQKQLPDLRRNPDIMAREHPESVKQLSVERGGLERAATLHARRTKPRGPHLFLHEPLAQGVVRGACVE